MTDEDEAIAFALRADRRTRKGPKQKLTSESEQVGGSPTPFLLAASIASPCVAHGSNIPDGDL